MKGAIGYTYQTLCGERIRLNGGIGASYRPNERTLSDVGESSNEKGSGIGVDIGQSAEMLTDLVEVGEGVLQSLDQSGHATKGRSLELFTLEQTLRVLQQADVISGDGLNQMLGC